MKPETWAIVGGRPERVPGAPLNTPIVPASNFVLGTERLYSRTEATDTWVAFEEVLKRWTDWDVDYERVRMAHTSSVRGWAQLPVRVR